MQQCLREININMHERETRGQLHGTNEMRERFQQGNSGDCLMNNDYIKRVGEKTCCIDPKLHQHWHEKGKEHLAVTNVTDGGEIMKTIKTEE